MLLQGWGVFPKNKDVEEALKSPLPRIIEAPQKVKSPHTGDPNEQSPVPTLEGKIMCH